MVDLRLPTILTKSTFKGLQGKKLPTWVFPKVVGKPPKWMVKIMENPIEVKKMFTKCRQPSIGGQLVSVKIVHHENDSSWQLKLTVVIVWGWVVPRDPGCSSPPGWHYIFRIRDPNLNLENLPRLHPGRGRQPKIYHTLIRHAIWYTKPFHKKGYMLNTTANLCTSRKPSILPTVITCEKENPFSMGNPENIDKVADFSPIHFWKQTNQSATDFYLFRRI